MGALQARPHRMALVIASLSRARRVAKLQATRGADRHGLVIRVCGDDVTATIQGLVSHTAIAVVIPDIASAGAIALAALRSDSPLPFHHGSARRESRLRGVGDARAFGETPTAAIEDLHRKCRRRYMGWTWAWRWAWTWA